MGCLKDDIQFLPGVGPKRAEMLKKIDWLPGAEGD